MATPTNYIISGKFAGQHITEARSGTYAYIQANGQTECINRLRAQCVNILNESTVKSASGAIAGTAVFGEGGAAYSGNKTNVLIEIVWIDGSTSLARVTPALKEVIIIGMYNQNISSEEETDMKNAEESAISWGNTKAYLLFFGYIFLLIIAAISGS